MGIKERNELLEKGIVSREVFEALYTAAKEDEATRLTLYQTWEFLKKLNIATEMENRSDTSPRLYIPSLIPDKNRKAIKRAVAEMRKSEHSLGFYISLSKSDSVSDLFSKFLCRLATKEFFYNDKNPGIQFDKSFAAKIENRSLGIVAGTKGYLTWVGRGGSQTVVDFVVVEMDCDNTDQQLKFARDKVN